MISCLTRGGRKWTKPVNSNYFLSVLIRNQLLAKINHILKLKLFVIDECCGVVLSTNIFRVPILLLQHSRPYPITDFHFHNYAIKRKGVWNKLISLTPSASLYNIFSFTYFWFFSFVLEKHLLSDRNTALVSAPTVINHVSWSSGSWISSYSLKFFRTMQRKQICSTFNVFCYLCQESKQANLVFMGSLIKYAMGKHKKISKIYKQIQWE